MIKLWNYRHISVGNMVRNSIQSCFFFYKSEHSIFRHSWNNPSLIFYLVMQVKKVVAMRLMWTYN